MTDYDFGIKLSIYRFLFYEMDTLLKFPYLNTQNES